MPAYDDEIKLLFPLAPLESAGGQIYQLFLPYTNIYINEFKEASAIPTVFAHLQNVDVLIYESTLRWLIITFCQGKNNRAGLAHPCAFTLIDQA